MTSAANCSRHKSVWGIVQNARLAWVGMNRCATPSCTCTLKSPDDCARWLWTFMLLLRLVHQLISHHPTRGGRFATFPHRSCACLVFYHKLLRSVAVLGGEIVRHEQGGAAEPPTVHGHLLGHGGGVSQGKLTC